ncbi:importin subunit alpha-6, partial [Trifolium medium]|nr:importin subunit alpha-6 [Trifolium medium]
TSFKTFSYDVYDPLVMSPSNVDFDANGSVEIICSSAKSLLSDDPIAQLDAMTKYARVLSIGSHALIDEVLENVIQQLLKFLAQDDDLQLQAMAVWGLNNIVAG